jgi:hypothetical protein
MIAVCPGSGYGAPGSQRPTYSAPSKPQNSITIPLPFEKPDFGQILREKQNILSSVLNIKQLLLAPVLGLGQLVVDTKLSLVRPLLAPVIGIKRAGLGFLKGLIDQKIGLLDSLSATMSGGGGGGGYGAPTTGYGAPGRRAGLARRAWRTRRP